MFVVWSLEQNMYNFSIKNSFLICVVVPFPLMPLMPITNKPAKGFAFESKPTITRAANYRAEKLIKR